ncbi:MAG TPA: DUF4833 domain-containing protein [Thermoanaerobaculia bacterium]|jgi:hypothetical protein
MHRTALAAVVLASMGLGGAGANGQTCPKHLFIVARSKNANVVAYDANPAPGGGLSSTEPVVAYWLLDGDETRREELTNFERARAYGVEGKPGHDPGTYVVHFKARGKRTLTVRIVDGCPVGTMRIGGHKGVLRRIFVQSKEGIGLPKILSIELFGEDLATKEPLHEKVHP